MWLTEVARLVPDQLTRRPDLPRPTPMTEGWQRQHFFEALARALLRTPGEAREGPGPYSQPLLLLLDDLQWCDNETLEWLHYLLRFDPRARLLLIGTVRSEETLPGHPLLSFLGTLQRDSLVTEIALGPLSTAETTSLAEHIMGPQLDPAMIDTLYQETEGNPLFIVETMRMSGGTGQGMHRSSRNDLSALPSTIQAIIVVLMFVVLIPAVIIAVVLWITEVLKIDFALRFNVGIGILEESRERWVC